ncbi:hypothetical protein CVT91_18530 [Candidatus Atribacteria bacterium HGW-Atribacteria-1]|nr:MAG: hypothetical protein CVT91_18530 [Candidatus Atribacteria bacterium HGW-Atribacteria-1]
MALSKLLLHLLSLATSLTIRDLPFSATQPAIPSPTFTLYFFISLLFLPRLALKYNSFFSLSKSNMEAASAFTIIAAYFIILFNRIQLQYLRL